MLAPKPKPGMQPEIKLIQDQAYIEKFLYETSLIEFSFMQDDIVFETVFEQKASSMVQFRKHAANVWTIENFGFIGGLDFKYAVKPAVEQLERDFRPKRLDCILDRRWHSILDPGPVDAGFVLVETTEPDFTF